VQLGEIDASHSFRVFDYWARNRLRLPGKTQVAVLVAKNTSGRYRTAL
jgi:predicted DCC family thiol-disulfide oxidoreductase YuxK